MAGLVSAMDALGAKPCVVSELTPIQASPACMRHRCSCYSSEQAIESRDKLKAMHVVGMVQVPARIVDAVDSKQPLNQITVLENLIELHPCSELTAPSSLTTSPSAEAMAQLQSSFISSPAGGASASGRRVVHGVHSERWLRHLHGLDQRRVGLLRTLRS